MSESHGVRPGETAAVPAAEPDEMKDAISSSAAQEPVADPESAEPTASGDRAADPALDDAEPAQEPAAVGGSAHEDEPAHQPDPQPEIEVEGDPGSDAPRDVSAGEEPTGEVPQEDAPQEEPPEEYAPQEESPEEETPPEPEEPTYRVFDCTGADFSAGAEAARTAIEAGECIVLPTDTVYGIGADAFNAAAVQRLLDAKERGRDMPPPVLIADTQMFKALAGDIPQAALDLVERFWPGALTVICTIRENLELDLGDMEGTIALRVPDHALARNLLRQTGPLAVSSANKTGRPSALDVGEAIEMLGNAVSVYLDGGRLADPGDEAGNATLPSTMVDFTRNEHGEVLRAGALTTEALQEVVPDLVGPKAAKPLGDAADIAAAISALPAEPVASAANQAAEDTDDEDVEDVAAGNGNARPPRAGQDVDDQ